VTQVTWSATDAAGNTATCTQEVEVTGEAALILPGDCNGDGELDVSDAVCLLNLLFLDSESRLPCGGGLADEVANVSLLDFNGDGALDVSDAAASLAWKFFGGPAHVLGSGCLSLPGCAPACRAP
jgi:hypothetical protein